MGYIKEPVGVDLNLSPMPLSAEDRQEISAIIAQYKSTGEIPKLLRKPKVSRKKTIAVTDGGRTRAKSTVVKKKANFSESK